VGVGEPESEDADMHRWPRRDDEETVATLANKGRESKFYGSAENAG
jgi:hypothetical protein